MVPRIVARLSSIGLCAGICLASLSAVSQTGSSRQIAAVDLVRATVANEAAASQRDSTKYMFRGFKKILKVLRQGFISKPKRRWLG